jgi:uncharacterized protein (TIGR03435 family)
MRASICLASLIVVTVAGGLLTAQSPDTGAFEVVSVKPNASGDERTSSIVMPGARYTATNVTLRMLIKTAYQVHDDQIVGGPGWVNTDRFDLTARGEGNPSTTAFITQARLMLRPALADRFNLVMRRETRVIPVYALQQVRSDRGLGPQLRESPNCSGPATPLPAAPDALEPIPDFPCGTGFSRGGHLGARGSEFSVLVRQIGTWTDRVLIDRTALIGRYDWDMQWTPELLTPDISVAPNRLPLETALRDQLGFKLEPGRDSVEVLVIDHAERPRPD